MFSPWALLGVFLFISYVTEAATGFGSIVIAVGLGAMVLPIPEMLPIVVPLNLISSTYFTVRYRKHIHWPTLYKLILPWMILGTLAGHFLKPVLGNALLKSCFGVLVLWFAARELWKMSRQAASSTQERPYPATAGLISAAGVTHGLFASGGPLLVYALASQSLEKTAMRSTLILVWLTLNGLLTIVYALDGTLGPALPTLGYYVPVVLAAMVVGEFLHHHINEQQFRRAIYIILAVAGIFLIIPR